MKSLLFTFIYLLFNQAYAKEVCVINIDHRIVDGIEASSQISAKCTDKSISKLLSYNFRNKSDLSVLRDELPAHKDYVPTDTDLKDDFTELIGRSLYDLGYVRVDSDLANIYIKK